MKKTHKVFHFAEKPETFVSDWIHAGIYCFDPRIFDHIAHAQENAKISEETFEWQYTGEAPQKQALMLEKDVIVPLSQLGSEEFYVFEYHDFWRQLKSAGSAVYCTELYLKHYAKTKPHLLAPASQNIIPPVMIDPTAHIHPTAVLGPNVYIGPNVTIGKGVRVVQSIIMENAIVGDRCLISWSVLASDCKIGYWSRVQGFPDLRPRLMEDISKDRKGITILGSGATVASETMILNCIVMSHKELSTSYSNEILL